MRCCIVPQPFYLFSILCFYPKSHFFRLFFTCDFEIFAFRIVSFHVGGTRFDVRRFSICNEVCSWLCVGDWSNFFESPESQLFLQFSFYFSNPPDTQTLEHHLSDEQLDLKVCMFIKQLVIRQVRLIGFIRLCRYFMLFVTTSCLTLISYHVTFCQE